MAVKKKKSSPVVPPPLKQGDTIGVAAPASPFDTGLFNKGVAAIKSLGFNVRIDDVVYGKNRWFSGTAAQRADHLNRLFKDPGIKAIVCARGGYGSMGVLPLLDIHSITANPKRFFGFSDISALLGFLYQRCGFVTYHGPVATTLGNKDLITRDSFNQCLSSDEPVRLKSGKMRVIKAGKAQGPVLCSNLATLCHLCGTPFMPDLSGHLLILEDVGEKPYRIHRMLSQLMLAGCIQGIEGLCLGYFKQCGSIDDIRYIVEDLFRDVPVPIMEGLPVGHGSTNVTLPVGLMAKMDTDRQHLVYVN